MFKTSSKRYALTHSIAEIKSFHREYDIHIEIYILGIYKLI